MDVIARGDNKISFRLRSGIQIDVRLLSPASFGAAMQYFTGSKAHNVTLRQRALKMGFTLSEYSLAETRRRNSQSREVRRGDLRQAESRIHSPEMRENLGEIDLPPSITSELITKRTFKAMCICTQLRQMVGTQSRKWRRRPALAGTSTWPSPTTRKTLRLPTGWTTNVRSPHQAIREAGNAIEDIRIFAGIEVDILGDGALDLSDPCSAKWTSSSPACIRIQPGTRHR